MESMIASLVIVLATLAVAFAADASKVNFLAVGDWGGIPFWPFTTPGQKASAKGMGKVAESIDSQFVIALGDNFYFSGIDDAHSSRFKETFQDVYTASSLMKPWYAIAGNHDHKGNVSAQIEYTQFDGTGRWQFPALYHSHNFISEDETTTIDLILLDTIDLCSMNDGLHEEEEGYFDPLPLRSKEDAPDQWEWLENKMAASTATYLLVGGHFPVYSVCDHGNTDTLIQHLKPMLEKYDAHYLSGHDHCMVHVQEQDKKVNYILSGMGDTCCYEASKKDTVPEGSLKWFIAKENHGHIFDHDVTGGFTSFQADKDNLSVTYHDQHGHTIFTADPIEPRMQS
jgi:tartrate-resistant acid phosphatase type 5